MPMRPGPPSSLDGIKRLAKRIKAEKGIKHALALNEAASSAGFHNFAHASRALASKGPQAPGRQTFPQPVQQRPTTMRSDFHTRAREDWVRSINTIAAPSSTSVTWQGRDDIVTALTPIMGSNRNHAHLPGGGMDIQAVTVSSEPGCIDLQVGRNTVYRVKPRRLLLERIAADQPESFFLLELDDLKPTGAYPERDADGADDRPFRDEEVVEVDGTFYPRSAWDVDELPNGDPLPNDAKLVVRLFAGKVMFMTKGSIWNGASETYDGRHARMGAADIRGIIERSIRS